MRILRKIFRPRGKKGGKKKKKIWGEKVCEFYSSINIITAIKCRRIRWTDDVVRMGK
jgi:hypothetical protein